MKARLSFAMTAAVLAALLVAPASQAQTQTPTKRLTQKVALTGATGSGKSFKGSYTVTRFARSSSGKLVAVGTVRGRMGGRSVAKRNVKVPARLTKPATTAQIPQPIPGACQVLVLDLRPITLNLLGLLVRTSRIVVRIDAVPGAGNLLGNLLCGLTGILDPATASTRQQAAALNAVLALVPRQ
jgi:hypothetical protein